MMLTDKGDVKIMDFGLAKVRGGAQVTKVGTTLGTAAYMSPEQARGEEADHRSDIWSFGVVFYEMLTGRLPFGGDYEQAITYAILNEEPEAVSVLRSDIPEPMQQIAIRALAKDPQDRYASTTELLEDLQGLTSRVSGQAQSLSLSKLMRKPKFVVPAMVLLIALGLLLAWWIRQNAQVSFARLELLPQIDSLVTQIPWTGEGSAAWNAFELANQAEQYIPDDPVLSRLWQRVSRLVNIHSDPPGATVYAKSYVNNDSEWRYFGQTPLDSLRFPRGFSRLKLELPGFQTVEDLFWVMGNNQSQSYELIDPSSIPEGMVIVEGGSRGLRMPDLDHLKAEHVNRFLIDRYEVTNKAYKKFVDAGGYSEPTYWKHPFIIDGRIISWDEAISFFQDKTGRPGPATWEVGDFADGKENYPVTGVSWYEAAAYAEFVGKDLPTIFHWNLAALTWASGVVIPASNLNGEGLATVGIYKGMTRFGTYDMAGNAREWTLNQSSHTGNRFILGGGWNDRAYAFSDAYTQSAFDRSPSNGFRCIKYVDANENQIALTRTIDLPFRDFNQEKPVPQETFNLLVRQFDYDKTPLNSNIESIDESPEDWVKEKVTFDAGYGSDRIIAYLFLPRQTAPPYQTVVYFPGDGGFGTHSTANIRPSSHFLKSGRAFLRPIYKSTYQRSDELLSSMPNESNAYREHVIMWSKDMRRSIDYLETRGDIDMDNLAYYGVSWGGRLAPIMLAVEQRFKAAILYVAGLRFQRTRAEAEPFNFLPRVSLPVLMLNGKHDFYFPYETSQKPFFELLGTPVSQKKWLVYDGGHVVPNTELVKESLAWLDTYLGSVDLSR
jgi:dienelactone hydrolase